MLSYQIINCRLCGSDLLQEIVALGDTPAGDLYKNYKLDAQILERYPLNCNICLICGHVQLSYFVNPNEIYSEYIYKTSDSLGLEAHFNSFSQDLANYSAPKNKLKVFEVGCNDGTLLQCFQKLGYETLGMDPANIPVSEARKKGLRVIESYFDQTAVDKVKEVMPLVDVIIANNVLANVEDLNSVFDGFVDLLSENGLIVFETGYLRYLAELKVIDNIHHEHIDYFAISPLKKFFGSKGLYIDRVVISDSKGSSIRVFVRRGKIESTPREVLNICEAEVANGYFKQSTYDRLVIDIAEERERLQNFIIEAKRKGLLVVGYGAAIGTTTLLATFNLESQIDFLVDDNSRRVGKFAPGTGIEVKGFEEIQDLKCVVVILAWRYQDAIKAKIGDKIGIDSVRSVWGIS